MKKEKFLTLFAILWIVSPIVNAQNLVTTLKTDQPFYLTKINTQLEVTILVQNVAELFAWQIKLEFDPSVIQCLNIFYPEDYVFGTQPSITAGPIIDNKAGFVLFGSSLIGKGAQLFEGSGSLCGFIFNCTKEGTSNLYISKEDSFLLDFGPEVIPTEIIDGQVEVTEILTFVEDLNRDGEVNTQDIIIAALAFGSFPRNERWDPRADLDRNGRIDMRDCGMVAKAFGKKR